jgi:hypothetical protein
MTLKGDSLAQLNKVKAQLTEYLIVNTAPPGTPAFAQLQAVAAKENEVDARIHAIIAKSFAPSNPADVQRHVDALTTTADQLVELGTTLAHVGNVLALTGTAVALAATILALAA